MGFLLLSCCAPCSCAVIKKLAEDGVKFSVLFYNPNIRPYEEYRRRCEENRRVCEKYGIKFHLNSADYLDFSPLFISK